MRCAFMLQPAVAMLRSLRNANPGINPDLVSDFNRHGG